jgi:hypothetical protein
MKAKRVERTNNILIFSWKNMISYRAVDLINMKGLDQHAPIIAEVNFTLQFITDTVGVRKGPFTKLVDKRRAIAVTRVLPYNIIIWPRLTVHELACVDGLTDECVVRLDRIPRATCCTVC